MKCTFYIFGFAVGILLVLEFGTLNTGYTSTVSQHLSKFLIIA
jgi:hypothetical protein